MNIGANIRYYRTQMDITQEALAERLSVSHQTVSKWERQIVSPDISLLPALADVFHISIDKLLNYSPAEEHAYTDSATAELRRLNQTNDLQAQKTLLEDALQKYPRNTHFAERYLNVCVPFAFSGSLSEEDYGRIKKIGDTLLSETENRYQKDSILRALALIASRFETHKSDAILYYHKLPSLRNTKGNIANQILNPEEYRIIAPQAILDHIYYAALHCRNLAKNAKENAEKIEKLLGSNRIIESIFLDESYGYLSTLMLKNHYDLSLSYADSDVDAFFFHAEKCLHLARCFNEFQSGELRTLFGAVFYDKTTYYDQEDYRSQYLKKYLESEFAKTQKEHPRYDAVFSF